ncbi:MAG: ABC transporter permease [Anaerolineae bacterium UTCFX2]|jgi:putative ABC transport system permease protein|nr:ABC transporter permease [Anaerolineales bacterium]OQY94251.1 MAG: ABC transporter permease [Anaerolineae bacterium UTCFX2]
MILFQSILEALESLATNKLRSGLTIIGIVIGVAAVISIVSIGRGAENTITGSIQGIGTNLLFVFRGGAEEVRNPKPITLGDANAIADPFQAPSIEGVAPVLNGSVSISFGGESTKTSLEGVTPIYSQVRNLTVSEGEFIREEHLLERASVVLLGSEVAKRLFGQSEGLVGATVHIEGQPFRVLGILESKGGSGFGNQDDRILVPLTTVQTRLLHRPTRDQVDMLAIQAVNANAVADASEEIAQILRARHRTKVGADDFTILSQQDFLDTARTITSVLTIFLGGIAAISLLVGGIGIMNIMLVSVTERTREIGLRKALGARRADILVQFLTESSLLSMFGGLIGIGLGALIAQIVQRIAEAQNTPIHPSIGLDTVLLATLFSTAVGLFFGLYPANRAASLEPVEALRYE